jgi:transposase
MSDKRLRIAVRDQMQLRTESVDQLLPPEEPVRALWAFVLQLDLSALLARIQVDDHTPGNRAIDPRTLVALWLQATLDGYGSARELAELCTRHLVYRWLCGDEPISDRTLSNFRVAPGAALDDLLTQSVAALCAAGEATLTRVAQDGVRVRAAAGASSFRRPATLAQHLVAADDQVQRLRQRVHETPDTDSPQQAAAKQRGAEDRATRVRQALAEVQVLQAEQAARAQSGNAARAKAPEQVRVSTTDPEARKMKMADGGFRPAYNVQFATTTHGGAIAGVAVTLAGTDGDQSVPMVAQLERRYGVRPEELLVDGGFATKAAVDDLTLAGVTMYAPLKKEREQVAAGQNPYAAKKGDSPAVAAWRQRMGTEAAKLIYRERSATAEWSNAQARNRGLQQFRVRGQAKVLLVATWFALAHNAWQGMALGVWRRK